MGWWDWVVQILFSLGLFSKTARISLLGLDNAGKTSLLHYMKSGSMSKYAPTTRTFGGVTFTAYDVGGHESWRNLWNRYYEQSDAIIFMLDSSDPARFEEARVEIMSLLLNMDPQDVELRSDAPEGSADSTQTTHPQLGLSSESISLGHTISVSKPFVLLCNKQDLPNAAPVPHILNQLKWSSYVSDQNGMVTAMPCSVRNGSGLESAFQWLSSLL